VDHDYRVTMRHNCTTGPRHLGGLGEEVADELQCAQVSRPISHNEVLASQGSTQYYTSWPWTVASATDLAAELNADLHWGKHIQATVARQSEQVLSQTETLTGASTLALALLQWSSRPCVRVHLCHVRSQSASPDNHHRSRPVPCRK